MFHILIIVCIFNVFNVCLSSELTDDEDGGWTDIISTFISPDQHNHGKWRVVNGRIAVKHEFPSLVVLRHDGSVLCGGTLLSELAVLTAAHCVQDLVRKKQKPESLVVVAGDHALNVREGKEQGSRAARIIIHPEYNSLSPQAGSDLAVVVLAKPISAAKGIRYVKLDDDKVDHVGKNSLCHITGWGSKDRQGNVLVRVQRKASVNIVSRKYCSKHFPLTRSNSRQLCAMRPNSLIGACRGDSGGPLFCRIDDVSVQVGIVSYGSMPCAKKNVPTVFTKVASYRPWISALIQKLGEKS